MLSKGRSDSRQR